MCSYILNSVLCSEKYTHQSILAAQGMLSHNPLKTLINLSIVMRNIKFPTILSIRTFICVGPIAPHPAWTSEYFTQKNISQLSRNTARSLKKISHMRWHGKFKINYSDKKEMLLISQKSHRYWPFPNKVIFIYYTI